MRAIAGPRAYSAKIYSLKLDRRWYRPEEMPRYVFDLEPS